MRYYITILLLIAITSGCHTSNNKISLSKGKLVTYTIPYAASVGFSTRFKLGEEEVIAFFNTETYKRMDIFTLDGKLVKEIPLKELMMIERHIVDITALNKDSFLALGQYHNNVYLINGEGKILQHTHINDSAPNGNAGWYTELSSNVHDGFIQNDSTLLFCCTFFERNTDTNLSIEASMPEWYRLNRSLPYFLSIGNVFTPHPQLHYALPGFYNRFLPEHGANAEMPHYTFTPDYVLLFSDYSDSLYLLDKHTYEISRVVKVASVYTSVGRDIETIEKLDGDSFNLRGSAAALIKTVQYDHYRDLYYIALRHRIPLNTTRNQIRHNRQWSLLVYNKDFKLIDEINMPVKYRPGEMFVTREGIMLNLDDYEKPNVPKQFQLFHVNQK